MKNIFVCIERLLDDRMSYAVKSRSTGDFWCTRVILVLSPCTVHLSSDQSDRRTPSLTQLEPDPESECLKFVFEACFPAACITHRFVRSQSRLVDTIRIPHFKVKLRGQADQLIQTIKQRSYFNWPACAGQQLDLDRHFADIPPLLHASLSFSLFP